MTTNVTAAPLSSASELTVANPTRFHPGWVILSVAAIGLYMSGPGQSYSVAAFIDPMLAGLSLQRTEFSMAYLVATLVSGISLPFVGRLLDAWGARMLLPLNAILLGLACIWMSRTTTLIELYIGFCCIRCLGQGALTLISTWLVGEWFEHRRGLAMGIVGLGGTLSVMSLPQINNALISRFDWQTTWVLLAIAVWGALILPALVLVRNRPEEIGLLPDGRHPADDLDAEGKTHTVDLQAVAARRVKSLENESWTVREAIRTLTFWKVVSVICVSAMLGTGLVFHQVSLLADHGISRDWALGLIGVQAIMGTFVSLTAGYLTDRIAPRFLLTLAMLSLASGVGLLLVLPSVTLIPLYAILLGLHGGIIRSTGTVVWINFYGRLHQGAVRGVAMSISILAAALGPVPLALAKDMFGDYRPALLIFLVIPLLAAAAVWSAQTPVKKTVQKVADIAG